MSAGSGRGWFLLPLVAALVAVPFLTACGNDDETPSAAEAEVALCADLDELLVALDTLTTLDSNSNVNELTSAVTNVESAAEDVEASAQDLEEANVDDLSQAITDLSSAADDIDSSATLEEASTQIEPEVEAVRSAWQEISSMTCGAGVRASPAGLRISEVAA